VDGNIVKAHGRSRAHTIKNAIGLAKQMVEQDILNTIKGEKFG
jgi:fatty acid/phospholipid biosynthesis enzyme